MRIFHNMRIDKIKISPMRIAGLTLLVIAWSNGKVSGILA
jgi:hypothetical protein